MNHLLSELTKYCDYTYIYIYIYIYMTYSQWNNNVRRYAILCLCADTLTASFWQVDLVTSRICMYLYIYFTLKHFLPLCHDIHLKLICAEAIHSLNGNWRHGITSYAYHFVPTWCGGLSWWTPVRVHVWGHQCIIPLYHRGARQLNSASAYLFLRSSV